MYYDWQLRELEEGDEVLFCINDIGILPTQSTYVGREGTRMKFEGKSREETPRQIEYGIRICHLSPFRGRVKIQERATITHYEK